MEKSIEKALQKMKDYKLEKEWRPLFESIINATEGGKTEGSIVLYAPYNTVDDCELLAFVKLYLEKFGLPLKRLSLSGNDLTYYPK